MNFRKLLLRLHLVVGLVSAALLIVSSVTGCVLAFEKELHVLLNRKLMQVRPEGERLPLDILAHKLEQAHPGRKVTTLTPSIKDDVATLVTLRPQPAGQAPSIFVNPYTAEVLGAQNTANPFMEKLRLFHRTLLLGEKGKIITACGAASLIVMTLSGVVLWWRQKLFTFGRSTSGARRNFTLHQSLGICAAFSLLVFALTGLAIFWEKEAAKLAVQLTGAPDPAAVKPAPLLPGAAPLGIAQIVSHALAAAPGARVVFIDGIGGLHSPVKVRMRYAEDHTPLRRTSLLLDPVSGKVLLAQGPAFKLWNQETHTGEVFGWPTRILSLLVSLALPVLVISGVLIWWSRIRRASAAPPAAP